jgi:hypothetical protein
MPQTSSPKFLILTCLGGWGHEAAFHRALFVLGWPIGKYQHCTREGGPPTCPDLALLAVPVPEGLAIETSAK